MKNIIFSTTLLLSALLIYPAHSDKNSHYAPTGKIGTLGSGLELTYRINKKLNAHFNLNDAWALQ